MTNPNFNGNFAADNASHIAENLEIEFLPVCYNIELRIKDHITT